MKLLTYLEWPEECFRLNDESFRFLRSLLPDGAEAIRCRSEAEFLRLLPDATHVVTWHFHREWFALAPALQLLATPAAGRELVCDTPPPGVTVHFGGYHGAIMAENVAAYMLAVSRGFFARFDSPWPRNEFSSLCRTLSGTRAVIAGYGRIGHAVADKLRALGVRVFGWSRSLAIPAATLDAELAAADWLVLALPSTTGTDRFLNRDLLAKLPPRCRIVNIGRGNAIDEDALVEALESERIAGAYLDVLRYEPTTLQLDFKDSNPRLLQGEVKNCIITPHSSAFSPDYLPRCFQELKDAELI